MKGVFGILGKALAMVRPRGEALMAVARREYDVASRDFRSLCERSWSDRGHL